MAFAVTLGLLQDAGATAQHVATTAKFVEDRLVALAESVPAISAIAVTPTSPGATPLVAELKSARKSSN